MAMRRSAGGRSLTVSPSIKSVPELMSSSPATSRSKVDLPQPEGPTKTTNSRFSIARSTPLMTCVGPKDLVIFLSSIAAMASGLPG